MTIKDFFMEVMFTIFYIFFILFWLSDKISVILFLCSVPCFFWWPELAYTLMAFSIILCLYGHLPEIVIATQKSFQ